MYKIQVSFVCAAALLAVAYVPNARAERKGEFSVFGGAHLFSENNELGSVDEADADSLENGLAFGVRTGFVLTKRVDLEGELAIMPTAARNAGVDVVAFGWRAHALAHLMQGSFRPFVLAGFGALTSSSDDERLFSSESDMLVHAGIGAKYDFEDNWGVRADLRLLLPPSSESESVTTDGEFFLGFYKTFGDAPPPPPKMLDDDGDGIANEADKCPTEAEDMDEFEDDDGCPELDNDGDGVLDGVDQYAKEAEDIDDFEDQDGCPDLDNDGDGILDAQDECRDQAEDMDDFMDIDGCPDPDNDSDGIVDADDRCPVEAETKNGFEDDDGCPDTVPEKVQQFSGVIQGIVFQRNSAKIRPSSFAILDQAVAVFTEYAGVRVEVQGHTDTEGTEEVNTKLSQDRAQAVVDYLVSKGIAADRLRAKGYGPSLPKEDNATKKGREANRRVEFQLITGQSE